MFFSRQIKEHVLEHKRGTVIVEGMFSCAACSESFDSKDKFRMHVRDAHLVQKEVNCPKCNKVCAGKSRLRKHMQKRHQEDRLMECFHCNKPFENKIQLKQHMRTHALPISAPIKKPEVPSSYICDVCGHEFRSLGTVNRHRLTHAEDGVGTNPPEKKRKRPNATIGGNLMCTLCDKSYTRCANLRKHLRLAHPIEGAFEWEKMLEIMCVKCDEVFQSNEALQGHKEMHNSFQCDICKQCMTTQTALDYHKQTHSSKSRPYKCTVSITDFFCYNTHFKLSAFILALRCNLYTAKPFVAAYTTCTYQRTCT